MTALHTAAHAILNLTTTAPVPSAGSGSSLSSTTTAVVGLVAGVLVISVAVSLLRAAFKVLNGLVNIAVKLGMTVLGVGAISALGAIAYVVHLIKGTPPI